jgi:hypothetical protein
MGTPGQLAALPSWENVRVEWKERMLRLKIVENKFSEINQSM